MSAVNQHVIAEQTIHAWCMDMTASVQQQDLGKHMDLISEKIKLYGLPGNDTIDYAGWRARRKYEFENQELLVLNYRNIRLINSSQLRIRFNVIETMVGKDGKMVTLDKNIVLENESDGQWRVVEENINSWQVKKINLANL
jgi:ketosteroid isomerase-like protein